MYSKAKALQLLHSAICDSENFLILYQKTSHKSYNLKVFCCSISVFVRTHLLNFHKFLRPGQSRVPCAGRELRDDEPDQGRGWGLGLIHNFREYAEQKLFGDFSYQIFKSNLSPHSTFVHDLISCPHMYFFNKPSLKAQNLKYNTGMQTLRKNRSGTFPHLSYAVKLLTSIILAWGGFLILGKVRLSDDERVEMRIQ